MAGSMTPPKIPLLPGPGDFVHGAVDIVQVDRACTPARRPGAAAAEVRQPTVVGVQCRPHRVEPGGVATEIHGRGEPARQYRSG